MTAKVGGKIDGQSSVTSFNPDDAMRWEARGPRPAHDIRYPPTFPASMVMIGRVAELEGNERGAIVVDRIVGDIDHEGLHLKAYEAVAQDNVARALLFFDKIEHFELISQWGAIGGSDLYLPGVVSTLQAELVRGPNLHELGFEVWKGTDNDRWSIWHLEGDDPLPQHESAENLAFRLRLQNALIVPHKDVPIEDILSFKHRHSAELMSLRLHIDELAVKIANSGPNLALARHEIEKFEVALAAHTKAIMRQNWRKSLANFTLKMSWSKAVGLATGIMSHSITTGVLAAIGAGLPDIIEIATVRGPTTPLNSPFAYCSSIAREL